MGAPAAVPSRAPSREGTPQRRTRRRRARSGARAAAPAGKQPPRANPALASSRSQGAARTKGTRGAAAPKSRRVAMPADDLPVRVKRAPARHKAVRVTKAPSRHTGPMQKRKANQRQKRRKITDGWSAARIAQPAAAGAAMLPHAAVRTADAVRDLSDSGLIVRLTRGRGWIAVLSALLAGIVAVNVVALSYNAGSGKLTEQISTLERKNSALRGKLAERLSPLTIEALGAEMGLIVPSASEVTYLDVNGNKVTRIEGIPTAGETDPALETTVAPQTVEPAPAEPAPAPAEPAPAEPAPAQSSPPAGGAGTGPTGGVAPG